MNIELLTIYTLSADGTTYERFLVNGAPVELVEYSYSSERMGMTQLTATVRNRACLDTLWTGREFVCLDEGALSQGGVSAVEKFFLAHTPSSSKSNEDERYVHNLEFRAHRDILLAGVYFCDAVNPGAASAGKPSSNGYEVKFYGTLDEFVQRFNDVLAARGLSSRFSVSIESAAQGTTESKEITFSNATLADALQKAVETWDVPFYFLGDSAVFGSADSSALVSVEYGAENELLSVSMNNRNEKRVTRISGVGSSDNVPYYYPNPTPKGTLALGGTFASDASIADGVLFAQKVGQNDTLTYEGKDADFGSVALTFAGTTDSESQGPTAAVEDKAVVSGTDYPFTAAVQADLSGGFDRRLNLSLYANVGYGEIDPDTEVCRIVSYNTRGTDRRGGYGTRYYDIKYVSRKVSEVAQKGWDFVIDRIDVTFGTGGSAISRQISSPCYETIVSDRGLEEGADRDLFSPEKLTGLVLDFSEILPLFPSTADLSHCLVTVNGHLRTEVPWCEIPSEGASALPPADFTAETVSVTSAFDPCGWYNGSEPLGEDLSVIGLSVSGTPSEGDTLTQLVTGYVTPTGRIMPSIYRDTAGAQRSYDADNTPPSAYAQAYVNPDTGQNYVFEHEYDEKEPHEHVEEFDVKPTIANLKDGQGNPLNVLNDVYFDTGYNVRDLLPDGETLRYNHFFVKLKPLGFNLFACAIENGEMAVVMSDGPCAGCHFKILVTPTGGNPVQKNANGTLKKDSDGYGVIDQDNLQPSQQDTTSNAVWIALGLDDSTFGGWEYGTMPAYDKASNAGVKPSSGNAYVLENILLPQAFFTAAEQELDRQMVRLMWENNADKFDPAVSFSRIYLAENPTVRSGLSDHSRLALTYDGRTFSPLYVSQITLNVKEGEPLPEIQVQTKDVVEPRSAGLDERIAAAADAAMKVVQGSGGMDLEEADKRYLRKDSEDTAHGKVKFEKGLEVGPYRAGKGGIGGTVYANEAGESFAEFDFLNVRKKAVFTEVEVEKLRKIGGSILLSLADITVSAVQKVSGGWKCWFLSQSSNGSALGNGFVAGDQAICQTYDNDRQHYLWRLVTEVGSDYIVLSGSDYDQGSDAPEVGDVLVQLGNRTDSSRQAAQILSCYGAESPSHVMYAGINSYSLDGKDISGTVYRETSSGSGVWVPYFFNYGPMLLGDRNKTQEYVEYNNGALTLKGTLIVKTGSTSYQSMTDYMAGVQGQISGLQSQIDGQVQSWSSSMASTAQTKPYPLWDEETQAVIGTPNYPYTEWQDATEREKHFGDIYVDDTTGQGYRFTKGTVNGSTVYYWTRITDEEVALAMQLAQAAKNKVDALDYLKEATNNGATLVSGGLILSNLIALGKTENEQFRVWAGVNGLRDTTKTGNGIAAWYGGEMMEKAEYDAMTPEQQAQHQYGGVPTYAKSLFRMDGSGYLAGGKISWLSTGAGSIPGVSWSADGSSIVIDGGVKLASASGDTVTELLAYVRQVSEWFEEVTENGLTYLKLKTSVGGIQGFATPGFISAGGVSSGGGSASVGLAAVWQTLTNTSTDHTYDSTKLVAAHVPDMASVYGYLKSADLDGYATDEDLDDVEDLLQAQIDSLASRDRFDELMATSFYADVIAVNDIFGYLHGTADAAAKLTTSGALNIWGVQYWNNGVPVAVTGRPELYIARTRVNNVLVNDTLLGIDAISNASSSGSSDQSRIVWEPNAGGAGVGAWHFLGNVYADGFISSGGLSQGGGQPAGNASLSNVTTLTHGQTGKVSASGVGELVLYDKDAIDYMIENAGQVKKVAGVSPDENGDVPVVSLSNALGLGDAAGYGVASSVAQGDTTHLVTGAAVHTAINNAVASVLRYEGVSSTEITDGGTQTPTIDGVQVTPYKGMVVLYGAKEFVWGGSAWEELGDEASWALKTITISAGTGLTGGGTLEANRTISLSQATIDSLTLANSAYQKPSGGIPNSDLANSAITIGSTSISLGGTTSVLAGLASVTSQKFYLDSDNYFEIVDGKVHLHVGTNGGFYTEGFVSAGGVSSGGGASSIDLAAMWASLQNNHNVDTYNAYKFAIAHLPSVGAGLTLTQSGTAPNLVTTLGIDSANYHLPTANEWANIAVIEAVLDNLQAQIDSVSSRDRFDELLATDAFMDTLSASSIYAEAIELNGANLTTTLAGKQDSISDLATIRSRADEGHTAYGYFSSGLLPWAKVNVGANDIVGTLGTTAVNRATADASGNTISTTYATITALNSVSGRVTTLESRTNWDTYFGVDEDGNVYVKMNGENARGFYSYGFVSAGGASSGGGSASVGLAAVWQTLTNTSTDHTYDSTKLVAAHVPDMASVYGYVKSVSIAEGATDGTIHIVVDGTAGSDVSVHGLGSAAFVSSSTFASASHTHTKSQITDFPTTWAWASITGAPSTMPNPFALTFGSKAYDGSEAKTITASDLGALTSHQSVTLAGGTNNYTMKLTTAAGTTDNVAVTGLAGAIDALQSQIDSIGSRDRFDELMATDFFADQLEASVAYVESVYGALIGNASTATDADKLDGQHGSYYATASSVSTLQGYFDSSGNAKSALKLTAVSKTAWGQTFWTSGGVPDSISGNMSSVGSISMNGSISGATTIEASTSVKAPKLYLDANTYFEVDSNGNVHLVVDSANGKGFYTEGFISAGGVSGGGGASGLDETAMWAALQRNSGVGRDKKLHYAHLPACGSGLSYTLDNSGIATSINVSFPVSSVAGKTGVVTLAVADITDIESWISGKGYITSASIPSTYAWSAITGTPTTLSGYGITDAFLASNFTAANIVSTLGTTAVNRATADASGNTITSTYATKTALTNAEDALWRGVSSVGAKDRFDELNASVFFSDVITGTTAYIETINGTLKGNADSATNATKLNGQSASYYAMASSLNSYLLLSGGTMTGPLKIATGKGIEDATGNGMLCYHPSSWTGVSSSQWGAGAVDCQGVIRSSASDLIHYRGNAAYVIWDSANDGSGSGLDADTVDGEHSSAFAHRGTANNLLVAGNEFNFISAGFSGDVYLNYQDENRQSAALVSGYNFCNGRGSTFAYIGASGSSFGANVSVTGNIAATGAITAGSASDARLKDDVRNLSGAVELIMALRPVSFKWNGKATELYEGYKGEDLGFIAQEVEPLLPMAISSIFERYKRLDQNKIIAPLVSVAQSHENRIRALERKVEFLEAENRRLRERLTN